MRSHPSSPSRDAASGKPLVIEARLNEWALRDRNPHVPWTPEEVARDAEACWRAGASIVHFHVRRDDGSPAHEPELYARAIALIRERCDILIHPTIAGVVTPGTRERLAPLRALASDPATRPDLVPMDMGSTNLDVFDFGGKRFTTLDKVYANSIRALRQTAEVVHEHSMKPLLVAWTVPCLRTIDAFIDAGWLSEPALVCIALTEGGILGGNPGTVEGLDAMLSFLPSARAIEWSVCCREGDLMDVACHAIGLGGHVSIGLGDYPYEALGRPTNAELVARVAAHGARAGRPAASVAQARALLDMTGRAHVPSTSAATTEPT
jgi:3-keto-5-aminohexanoate cleavage enzyme